MARVVIDPVTRIGGHLRVETALEAGVVSDAWSSGTTFRGFEGVLRGRDPRDAYLFAQRICGLCNGVHAQASVRAVEDALGLQIPSNARVPAQPAHGRRVRPGPRHRLLHAPVARLGGLPGGADRRPVGHGGPREVHGPLVPLQPRALQGRPGPPPRLGGVRPARDLRERVVGPSGVHAPAGGRPPPDVALPRRARLAAPVLEAADDARGQEPAPPVVPRRRDGDGPAVGRPQRRPPRRAPAAGRARHAAGAVGEGDLRHDRPHRRGAHLRRGGPGPGHAPPRAALRRVGHDRRRARELHVVRRVPARRHDAAEAPLPARPDHGPRPRGHRHGRGRTTSRRPSPTRTTRTRTATPRISRRPTA